MIIEIFQWFESPLFVSPVVLVNLFYLSCLNDFLNQSKNLMSTDRDTLYQVLKKKTFAFIHGTHDKLSCECLFGVIPFDIWSYCENLKVLWSVHVLPGIFYFEILILGSLWWIFWSVWEHVHVSVRGKHGKRRWTKRRNRWTGMKSHKTQHKG